MANYETLKSAIQQVVKTNGNNEITGALLQQSLLAMINSLGSGYQFVDVATTATKPGTPDQKVFYIANGKGTYTNFGGISIDEDEVVILYYDTAWHKLLTGIASQAKLSELEELIGKKADEADLATVAKTGKYADLVGKPTTLSGYGITDAYTKTKTDELLNAKQNELTLTVKDNGNIVIGNIMGQTEEFMPATPSGDPMHWAYVAAGAEYNDTGADIVKTAPWADLADDEADKTVVHKAGYWYLNGLGDITNRQMLDIYSGTHNFTHIGSISSMSPDCSLSCAFYRNTKIRTNFPFSHSGYNIASLYYKLMRSFQWSVFEVVFMPQRLCYMYGGSNLYAFSSVTIKHILNPILLSDYKDYDTGLFSSGIKTFKMHGINCNIKLVSSPLLTLKTILYMIQNEAATSTITITLHADAYTRAMASDEIVAALAEHPNISLASA